MYPLTVPNIWCACISTLAAHWSALLGVVHEYPPTSWLRT